MARLICSILLCIVVAVSSVKFYEDTGVTDTASFTINTNIMTDFDHFWERCVGSGHALLALREDYRHQLKKAHEKLGMQRVRFHGIFDDDLSAYQYENGPVYSFYNQDNIYDYLLSIGMQPYVELSFMPEDMASGPQTIFHYKGNITPPKNWTDWYDLIQAFANHLIERYGIDEVRSWYFETWNEPNCGFWSSNQTEYFTLLQVTSAALKAVDSQLQVGGPATCQSQWINETLNFVRENNVALDFVSTHEYPTDIQPVQRGILRKVMQNSRNIVGDNMTLIYSETNDGLFDQQLHDTIYASAFAVFNMIDLQGIADIVSWWSFSDIFEEGGFNSLPFNAGYGLQTIYNIDKPAFKAFELLHESGNSQYLTTGSHPTAGLIATENGTHIHVLIYNHQIPGAPIDTVNMSIAVQGIPQGHYVATLRRIDETYSNPIAAWEQMESPEYPTPKQIEFLQAASEFIHLPISGVYAHGSLNFEVSIPPHGVASITFPKK